MQAGDLDTTVTLYSPATAQDAFGEAVRTWTSVGTFAAVVEELGGSEGVRGGEAVEDKPLKVTLRHGSGVQTDYKLVYGTETYRITSVRMVGRQHWTELQAVKMGDSESGG